MENTQEKKQRVLSLIKPTSIPTLGNYLGALKNWKQMSADYDCIFGVADLHALTVRIDPAELRRQTQEMLALYLALDLQVDDNIVFVQSHVHTHSELAWVLNCFTQFGEASRMTQFKDKSRQHADNITVGLFDYPVLMAADILIYQSDFVPVGVDQKQHLELARNIADRFNGIYGNTFTLPEPLIGKKGAKIMSLQDPTAKMSKTDVNPKATVSILDTPDAIAKKIKSAVTDSEACVRYADGKDGINNLMTIYACCTGLDYAQIEHDFAGKGYGDFKAAVAEAVIEELRPLQEKYKLIISDKSYIAACAEEGAKAASYLSQKTLRKVQKKVGLWQL